ncbi:MAG TPA: basic secretory protein-like protein [Mucilaginibacter sp.]
MKKYILLLSILYMGYNVSAQKIDTIKKNALTLVFVNKDTAFSVATKQRLIDAFFKVYPEEIKQYNKNSSTLVTFIIDPDYKGVAATSRDIVRFNPDWLVKHPEDIDVVTHEVMHIVQNYGHNKVPGWLTEGIADYARYRYGINNEKSGWKLTEFSTTQNYTNAYRITARFLVWAEKNKDHDLVKKLDAAMREGTYTPEIWTQLTGKPVEELWKEYSENPVI